MMKKIKETINFLIYLNVADELEKEIRENSFHGRSTEMRVLGARLALYRALFPNDENNDHKELKRQKGS